MLRQRGLALAVGLFLALPAMVAAQEEPEAYQLPLCDLSDALCEEFDDPYWTLYQVFGAEPQAGAAGLVGAVMELQPDTEGTWSLQRETLELVQVPAAEIPRLSAGAGPAMPVIVAPEGVDALAAGVEPMARWGLAPAEDLAASAPTVQATVPLDPRDELAALLLDLSTFSWQGLLSPEPEAVASAPPAPLHASPEDVPGFAAKLAAPPLAAVGLESLGNEPVLLAPPALDTAPPADARPPPATLVPATLAPMVPAGRDLLAAAVAAITIILLVPPLYHRLHQHQLLEHEARARLYKLVVDRPGIHIEELARLTACSRSTVVYHLRLLARHGYVVAQGGRKSVHYYPNTGGADPDERERRALLTSPRARALAARIVRQPGIQRAALAADEGISVSTLSWHLGRLLRAGLVDDRLAPGGRELHPAPGLAEMLRPWLDAEVPARVVVAVETHAPGMPPATEAAAPP